MCRTKFQTIHVLAHGVNRRWHEIFSLCSCWNNMSPTFPHFGHGTSSSFDPSSSLRSHHSLPTVVLSPTAPESASLSHSMASSTCDSCKHGRTCETSLRLVICIGCTERVALMVFLAALTPAFSSFWLALPFSLGLSGDLFFFPRLLQSKKEHFWATRAQNERSHAFYPNIQLDLMCIVTTTNLLAQLPLCFPRLFAFCDVLVTFTENCTSLGTSESARKIFSPCLFVLETCFFLRRKTITSQHFLGLNL